MLGGSLTSLMNKLGARADACFRVEFADGSHYQNRPTAPAFTVRFRQRSAQTVGIVYNPGEPVEGYTNFLWVALMSIPLRLGVSLKGAASLIAVASVFPFDRGR